MGVRFEVKEHKMSQELHITYFISDEGWIYTELAGLLWLEGRASSAVGVKDENGKSVLHIPSEIDGHSVYMLLMSLDKFDDADKVVVPEGVGIIGDLAFARRARLKEIAIPASVIEIASSAFEGSGIPLDRQQKLYAIHMDE